MWTIIQTFFQISQEAIQRSHCVHCVLCFPPFQHICLSVELSASNMDEGIVGLVWLVMGPRRGWFRHMPVATCKVWSETETTGKGVGPRWCLWIGA